MKRILLCLISVILLPLSYSCTLLRAQTLHAIIFADTNDPNIGIFDKQDYINMTMEVSTIASATGMKLNKHFFSGENCSKAQLIKVLDGLNTNNDDVIIFYYSGHGTRSLNDRSEYPQMCLGSRRESEFFPLESVLNKLKAQNARLKIVFGDCCNSISPGVTSKESASKGFTVLTKGPVNTYTNLFMNYKGFIIASGSKKGENSITLSYNDGSPAGGAFTIYFLSALQAVVKQGLDADWNTIFGAATDITKEKAKHTPVVCVSTIPTETVHTVQAPENTATGNADSEDITAIDLLTAIGNEEFKESARIEVMQAVLPDLFATPNVKVESVGRNGTTIVSTETASDFMLRLCTAHNLVNLVELESKIDNAGKYTYLKIHEIYKDYK